MVLRETVDSNSNPSHVYLELITSPYTHPGAAYWRSKAKFETWKSLVAGLPSPLMCTSTTALQVLYDSLMNTFELCTKRSPRRLGVHAWEKYLTADEFQDLSTCRDEAERVELLLEEQFSPELVQVTVDAYYHSYAMYFVVMQHG
jgi:hypothetical protein